MIQTIIIESATTVQCRATSVVQQIVIIGHERGSTFSHEEKA